MKLRKKLNADDLFATVLEGFNNIKDSRQIFKKISLPDAFMSGFAMFSLKDPSLLSFDKRRKDDEKNENLKSLYGIKEIPSDTQMRSILDEVNPKQLRPIFKILFSQLQRGKALEKFSIIDDYYLISLDGTQYFMSEKIHSDSCMEKKSKKEGVTKYYQQMLGAAMVHPNHKEVIPLFPEMIIKQDGNTKNDCERNAAKRWLKKFRIDHPSLRVIITEDGLSSNAPHIKELQKYNCRFVLGVKPDGNKFLFDYVENASQEKSDRVVDYEIEEISTHNEKGQKRKKNKKIIHKFRFMNNVPLNESNQYLKVNFIDYWQVEEGKKKIHFSWVTDIAISKDNCFMIMRAGRARWKIENETFNTLKNQGYNFGHNYGLGKKNLSVVFVMLMMLAFLVDQIQQLCCKLFNAVWKELGSKRLLWETIKSFFNCFKFKSMEMIYRAILNKKVLDYWKVYDTS